MLGKYAHIHATIYKLYVNIIFVKVYLYQIIIIFTIIINIIGYDGFELNKY